MKIRILLASVGLMTILAICTNCGGSQCDPDTYRPRCVDNGYEHCQGVSEAGAAWFGQDYFLERIDCATYDERCVDTNRGATCSP